MEKPTLMIITPIWRGKCENFVQMKINTGKLGRNRGQRCRIYGQSHGGSSHDIEISYTMPYLKKYIQKLYY